MNHSFVSAGALLAVALGATLSCADRTSDNKGGGALLDAPSGSAPDGGAGGNGSGKASRIGQKCVQDRDCNGLKCLTSASTAFFGGGPPNGICTADCQADPSICSQQLDPNSVCVGFGSDASAPAYCLQRCTIGAPADSKCHGRTDFVCDDSNSPGDAWCLPLCGSDADCGTRKCDFRTGRCVDATDVSGTLPLGADCDPTLVKDPCNGVCVNTSLTDSGPQTGVCNTICTIGAPAACGETGASATLQNACLFATSDLAIEGDLGVCSHLCDCNDDCNGGLVCRPFTAAQAQGIGRAGYCSLSINSMTGKPAENIPCSGAKHDAGTKPPVDSGADAKPPVDSGKD
ncbi:MAG TPA: hypothetical protein VHE30_26085 [Polyangiaceae bacterium]|nr:hypothetical protein [Polyangiaceae bacterium]